MTQSVCRTVRELREKLKQFPQDAEICVEDEQGPTVCAPYLYEGAGVPYVFLTGGKG